MDSTRIEFLIIDILFFHDFFDDLETIVSVIYDKILTIPELVDEHPEKKRCCRVKSTYHRESVFSKWIESMWIESELGCDSLSHLLGCLVGKSYTKNRTRLNSLRVDHRDDSFGDGMSLSGSCSSIDQEWTIDSFDSFELLRIEL